MIKNGHSEKNQQKRSNDIFNLNFGETKEIELKDLSIQEQEKILMSMEMMGEEQPPKMYCVDVQMYINDYDRLPIKFLFKLLKFAIEENYYEDAEYLKKIIKKRNFSIMIKKNTLSLNKNK